MLGAGLCLMTGCREREEAPAAVQTEKPTEVIMAQTELTTELYEIETETDFFGEILMRSIWEVMSDETRLWAAAFRSDEVEKVVYTTYLETTPQVFEVADPDTIQEIFDAINQMTAGGSVAAPTSHGDVFEFCMKDGSSQKFVFSLTCIVEGSNAYETDQYETLWNLTGDLIFGEEATETENWG